MTPEFIHLRVRTAYSLAEGAIKISEDKKSGKGYGREDLLSLCEKYQMPAVAMTDKGNLFGALEFSMELATKGIQPIIGADLVVLASADAGEPPPTLNCKKDRILLLVQNEEGYKNLSRLVSLSYTEKDRPEPAITMAELEANNAGLLALVGHHEALVGRALVEGRQAAASKTLKQVKEIFGNRLYQVVMWGQQRRALNPPFLPWRTNIISPLWQPMTFILAKPVCMRRMMPCFAYHKKVWLKKKIVGV
jgi:DNA polymerase III subunit alpha